MIGIIVGFVVAGYCVVSLGMDGSLGPFYDLPSIGIVFGGIIGTMCIQLPMGALKQAFTVFMKAATYKPRDPVEIIKRICEYSEVARRDGILALEGVLAGIDDAFLRQGLQLAVDGTDPELIADILETEMGNLEDRHNMGKKVWETFKNGGPSWGALGTVIGLIIMLKGGVEDPNKLTAGMAVALITTFYGSIIASYLVGPIVDRLDVNNKDEIALKTIMLKGIMAIQAGDNPRIVEQKLKIFLPPRQRGFGKEPG